MRKIFLILPAIFCLLMASCNKATFDDLGGSITVRGVVMQYDTLEGITSGKISHNNKVFLAYPGDTTGFIYSVTTNDQGQYNFTGLHPDSSYTIYSHSDTGTVKYFGILSLPANHFGNNQSDTLKLYPSSTSQNGIHLIVRGASGAPISNARAWVFNNLALFNADSSAGHIIDMITNTYGVSNVYNIATGNYYLRVRMRIGNIMMTGETNVFVPAKGIVDAVINLTAITNGIELFTRDIPQLPISGATTYYYRSYTVFQLDVNNQNSLFTTSSDASGRSTIYNIDPATYYFRSIKVIGSVTLKYESTSLTDGIPVNATTVTPRTVTLQ